MLETGSGRLLASRSFTETFSQLQFAGEGLSYLLHRGMTSEGESIELRHFDVTSRQDTLVKGYKHVSLPKARPSQWRGSLSADGSLFAFQASVVVPAITVLDGLTGRERCQITWQDDYTALPVYFHPSNKLIVIPIARWDGDYRYGTKRQLLLADTDTGRVIARYEHDSAISNIRFEGDRILIYDCDHQVGCVQPGDVAINWEIRKEPMLPGGHQQLLADSQTAAYFLNEVVTGAKFHPLQSASPVASWKLEPDYLPIGLKGSMLVSQKYHTRELPAWVQSLNTRCMTWLGWYLISPMKHILRYQDAATGTLRCELHQEIRHPGENMAYRVAGESHLAVIYAEKDQLVVKVIALFPFWTMRNIVILAVVLTLLSSWGQCWLKAPRRQPSLEDVLCQQSG